MTKNNYFSLFISHFSFRKYPLSLCCIVLIWVLSLVPFFPETPLDGIDFIDKWTHLVMYGGTALVFWWEYARHKPFACHTQTFRSENTQHLTPITPISFSLFTFIFLTAMGGLLELIQNYCTTTRSGEWLDFWADSLGALLGTGIGLLIKKLFYRM